METFIKSTSQGNPSDGNPSPFPSFKNIGAPYMEMLSLPEFSVSLSICYFPLLF